MGRGKKDKKKSAALEAAVVVESLECPNTLSSNNVRQKHLALELDVLFERRVFAGAVEITFETLQYCEVLTLDTRDLFVSAVWRKDRLQAFRIKKEEVPFGRALEVVLDKPMKQGKTFSLRIEYETSPNAIGLQWLAPSLTEGKKHPYVFSQFQCIHARSFVPCQDTPMFKVTYEAVIRVPSALTALMSAIGNGKREEANGRTAFYFTQKVTVPTYLIAIVVGNVHGRVVGPISTVWAEPEVLERAANEFAEVNEFIKQADAVTDYPYRKLGWGKYDILVLPKSFPYGGMENPTLTFVTPTLLAGDRSATATIIHELAHSWFGNAITCRTWECFWMNEGFTCWLERKIVGRIHGDAHRDLSVLFEDAHLKDSLKRFSGTPAALSLVQDMTCTDPDDFYSSIPYEKGSQLLYWLEKAIVQNSSRTFESCIQAWIKKNVHGTVTSEEFQQFFEEYYATDAEVLPRLSQIPWHAWFHDRDPRGTPVDVLKYCDDSLLTIATDLAKIWIETKGLSGVKESDVATFDTQSRLLFLQALAGKIDADTFERIDKLYHFSAIRNPEVRFAWLMQGLALKVTKEEFLQDVDAMLSQQGRMKFTRPLYRSLAEVDRARALQVFAKNASSYHPICTRQVQKDFDESERK